MSFLSIIALIVGLVVIGVILHYVRASDKIDPGFKTLIYVVVAIAVAIFLLMFFGIWGELKSFRVG